MSRNEKNLSDYISFLSSDLQMYSVVAGFMFTAITLLVTLLPDPSQLAAQATLFALTVILGLCTTRILDIHLIMAYCVRVAAPLPEGFRKRGEFLSMAVLYLLGLTFIPMFLLWNLTHLTLATVIVDALLIIFVYFHEKPISLTMRRFEAQTKKSWRVRKFFDERDKVFESED